MPYNATLHRLHTKMTRGQLEQALRARSGSALHRPKDTDDPTLRRNRKYATWKRPSKETPNGRQCVLRSLVTGVILTGRNWNEVAVKAGIA